MDFAEQLARAGVCGTRPGCSVHFTAKVPSASEIAATLDRQMDEPTRSGIHLAGLYSDDDL
jgi:hypothetical protein